jgi:transposase-like protein
MPRIFQDPEKARELLEATRWPTGPFCPHCGGTERIHKVAGKRHRPGLYACRDCNGHFTVTVGTVFERSKIALNVWFQAVFLLCSSKKGISSHQLHRTLGVTYKTAWFMTHRIREAMRKGSACANGWQGRRGRGG